MTDRNGHHGRQAVIPGRQVKLSQRFGPVVVGQNQTQLRPLDEEERPCRPTVELIREGTVVRAIEVTCTCGEKIRLDCQYQ
ncbi:MAG: hypothetical protein KatS3mg105_0215 [Gemmatales bacterium]|nr:MAG: hypothetical protein KatS3mg105_0215 [Gemmatales bacterium]